MCWRLPDARLRVTATLPTPESFHAATIKFLDSTETEYRVSWLIFEGRSLGIWRCQSARCAMPSPTAPNSGTIRTLTAPSASMHFTNYEQSAFNYAEE